MSEPLQLFYLEQSGVSQEPIGPVFAGFRPFQLDDLLGWALASARQRGWEAQLIETTVLQVWMERAEVIRQWQLRLKAEPSDRLVVAGLGTSSDWQHRCEGMLRA
uniref:hypothetical protein n=1 Tax=Synechococcus sp. CS-1329 TaxID=2847975 RepID=UPI0028804075|nr:hypothetical protein [Synechococcus sp. CS-1329]